MDMSGMSTASSTMTDMAMSTGTSAMSGMNMATSTMSGMTMETGSAMGSMDGSMMSMQGMMMVFFTATDTPLYSAAWTPSTTGQYAGTCIFLIALAVIFRCILAVRMNLSSLAGAYAWKKDTHILRARPHPDDKTSTRPWTLNNALIWASVDTVLAGVSYLLMLAVMTMNVGYFLSILGGTFAGSFIVGKWTAPVGH